MKVAIISSCCNKPSIKIEDYLPADTTMVITGGGKGIDVLAEKYAHQKGIPKLVCPPKMFGRLGKAAIYGLSGFMLAFADRLVAFCFGTGKDDAIQTIAGFAKSIGKEVAVYSLADKEKRALVKPV